ncbi:MAG TPA: YihY/virulence factor BrkB family protein, partial [Thermoanaerobaculia bacterium]|nr:YihY/virulence factor BrkB family protein [Thermoanaerobaculia bacterium]
MSIRSTTALLKEAAQEWSYDRAPRLAAALSFYTLFSVAPLLVIAISIAGLVFGEEAARGEIVSTFEQVLGPIAAAALEQLIANASREQETGLLATVLGLAALLFGASRVMVQLKEALNSIWNIRSEAGGRFLRRIRNRFLSFAMVLGVGFLLLVSLLVSAAISTLSHALGLLLPRSVAIWEAANLIASFGIITLLFAAIFRFIPDRRVAWRDVWLGAAFASLLFVLGKSLIGVYLGRSVLVSAYGAAASLVVLLLWIYYSSMILFFGAELTEVYARRRSGGQQRARPGIGEGAKPPTP